MLESSVCTEEALHCFQLQFYHSPSNVSCVAYEEYLEVTHVIVVLWTNCFFFVSLQKYTTSRFPMAGRPSVLKEQIQLRFYQQCFQLHLSPSFTAMSLRAFCLVFSHLCPGYAWRSRPAPASQRQGWLIVSDINAIKTLSMATLPFYVEGVFIHLDVPSWQMS